MFWENLGTIGLVGLVLLLLILGSSVVGFFWRVLWPEWARRLALGGEEKEKKLLGTLAQVAVKYAEQFFESNEERKRAAVAFLQQQVQAAGIDVDAAEAEVWVEAAVFEWLGQRI